MPKVCEVFESGIKIFGRFVDFDEDRALNTGRNELEYEKFEIMKELMKVLEIIAETDEGIELIFLKHWYASQVFYASEFKPQICTTRLDTYEENLKKKKDSEKNSEQNSDKKQNPDWFE